MVKAARLGGQLNPARGTLRLVHQACDDLDRKPVHRCLAPHIQTLDAVARQPGSVLVCLAEIAERLRLLASGAYLGASGGVYRRKRLRPEGPHRLPAKRLPIMAVAVTLGVAQFSAPAERALRAHVDRCEFAPCSELRIVPRAQAARRELPAATLEGACLSHCFHALQSTCTSAGTPIQAAERPRNSGAMPEPKREAAGEVGGRVFAPLIACPDASRRALWPSRASLDAWSCHRLARCASCGMSGRGGEGWRASGLGRARCGPRPCRADRTARTRGHA